MRRVLFANPFGIGDVLFTLSSVEKLRREDLGAHIGFIGNERTAELLALYPPVDKVHVFNRDALRASLKKSPFHYFAAVRKLVDEIRLEKYDTLVDFSLGREFALAARFAGIRERAGFDYRGRGIFLTKKKKLAAYEGRPVAQQQLDFLKEAGVLSDSRMPDALTIVLKLGDVDVTGDILAIAPGGGKSWGKDAVYKQWDPERYVELVTRIMDVRPGLLVAVTGDESEKPLLEKIKAGIGREGVFVLAGRPLATVSAILRKSKLFIGNDGGLAHLAHALGTRTLTIFGPVDERAYAPYGPSAEGRTVRSSVECRPCYGRFHFPACPHERRCLTAISVDKVIEPALEIL